MNALLNGGGTRSEAVPQASRLIELDRYEVRYPRFVLGPITNCFHAGEHVVLLGRNGAGKSTLLGGLAGRVRSTSGSVIVQGQTSHTVDDALFALRSAVSYVGAELNAIPWYPVHQHFDLMSRVYPRWDMGVAESLADRLSLDLNAITGTLSRGNTLKLNICSAWATQAQLLLLDEPTAGLDPIAREELLFQIDLLLRFQPSACVILATHMIDDLKSFAAGRFLALSDGQLSEHVSADATLEALRFTAPKIGNATQRERVIS